MNRAWWALGIVGGGIGLLALFSSSDKTPGDEEMPPVPPDESPGLGTDPVVDPVPTGPALDPGALQPVAPKGGLDASPASGAPLVPVNPSKVTKLYPTPGWMFQPRSGQTLLGENPSKSVIYQALSSAAYMAAKKDGASDDEAKQFARSVARDDGLRLEYYDAMLCAGINDATYGTLGFERSITPPGPHGRAIELLPRHADNKARVAAGKPMLRTVRLKTGTRVESGYKEFPWLYLPALDEAALQNRKIAVASWRPPFAHSVAVLEPDLVGRVWGCGDGEELYS